MVKVSQNSDNVVISGIPLQAGAVHLSSRFRSKGIRATIGLVPGVAGYIVMVHERPVAEVIGLLREFGMMVDE
jgi:hypothetical protein